MAMSMSLVAVIFIAATLIIDKANDHVRSQAPGENQELFSCVQINFPYNRRTSVIFDRRGPG